MPFGWKTIISLWKLGLRDETLSTLFNINKDAIIKVRTPMGLSEVVEKERIVKQGTVSGPPMCSTSTAEFADENDGVRGFPIGNTAVHTMILMDDIVNVNSSGNCLMYMEIGILPVLYEVHILKLNFLHHILTLDTNDPVLMYLEHYIKIHI